MIQMHIYVLQHSVYTCISCKKTVWGTTRLDILGIKLDSVTQTSSITTQRWERIRDLSLCILECGCASLLELQQVAGLSLE